MSNSLIPSKEFRIRSGLPNIDVEYFTQEEIEIMRSWISEFDRGFAKNNGKRYRDMEREKYALLFEFLLRTGGRVSEVLALTPSDIDLAAGQVNMKNLKQKDKKKGKKSVPLHPELRREYERYMMHHSRDSRTGPIFSMTRSAVDQFFKRMNRELEHKGFEITKDEKGKKKYAIHAHRFRHTFAVNAMLSGMPLNILQNLLGHSNVWTTSVYTKVTAIDAREYVNRMYRPKENVL
jgi:integrase